MYKYFTRNNTYRCIDVLDKLVVGYYRSVHSAVVISPVSVNPSNIYAIWRKLHRLQGKIPKGKAKFKSGDLVRITREKLRLGKGYEQTFSTEIFRIVKVINRTPQPVYELADLQDRPIESQFYNYELVKVNVTPETEFKIDKIVRTLRRRGITRTSHQVGRI
jgi:hypothetical protein